MTQSIFVIEPMLIGVFDKYKLINLPNPKKQKVYLLGNGWLAKGFIDYIDKNQFIVINITRNKFVNTPLLLQSLKKNSINEINLINEKKIDKQFCETIENIDLINKTIKTNCHTFYWSDAFVVCGLGSHVDQGQYWTDKINLLKEINKQKIPKQICIVGAGPTGTELSSYLSDFNHDITLLDGLDNTQLYSYLSNKSKYILYKNLKKNNITLSANTLYNNSMKFDHVIFATGSRPNDLTSKMILSPYLNLYTNPNVYAGGDGINQPGLPRNAQVAYQQGKYIARRLNGEIDLDEKFNFDNNGIALYIGNNNHLIEIWNKTFILPSIFVELYYKIFT